MKLRFKKYPCPHPRQSCIYMTVNENNRKWISTHRHGIKSLIPWWRMICICDYVHVVCACVCDLRRFLRWEEQSEQYRMQHIFHVSFVFEFDIAFNSTVISCNYRKWNVGEVTANVTKSDKYACKIPYFHIWLILNDAHDSCYLTGTRRYLFITQTT